MFSSKKKNNLKWFFFLFIKSICGKETKKMRKKKSENDKDKVKKILMLVNK